MHPPGLRYGPLLERMDDRLLVGLIAVPALVNALLWAFTIPFNQAPDEAAHFHVVRFIVDHGRLPIFSPDELWLHNTSKGVVESYAPFPPLAYVVGAVASRLTDGTMWGARMVSTLSYVATAALTYLIGRQLRLRPAIALSAALLVAFLPQFVFTGAYVNSDAIGVALTAMMLWLLLRSGARPSIASFIGLGVLAGALLLTKYTFYPAALIGVAVAGWQARRQLISLTALIAALLATSVWWFARNWMLYGEIVPVRVIADAKAAAGGNTLFVPAEYGISLLDISTRTDFWWATFTSFVGKFGFIAIELHPAYYLACLGLLAIALAGAIVGLRRRIPSGEARAQILVGAALIAGTALFAMWSSVSGEYSPQGRYLFAALVPIAIGLAAGWSWLGEAAPVLRFVPAGATGAIVALNFLSLFGYVIPAHFGTGGPHIVVQVDPPRSFTDIEGWAILEGGSTWRPFSPAVVADYRQPAAAVRAYAGDPAAGAGVLASADYGLRRDDVAGFYGGFPAILSVGYRLSWPPESRSAGLTPASVCAIAAAGEVACGVVPTAP